MPRSKVSGSTLMDTDLDGRRAVRCTTTTPSTRAVRLPPSQSFLYPLFPPTKRQKLHGAISRTVAGVRDGAQLYVAQHSGTSPDSANLPASAMVPQPGAGPPPDPMAAMLNSPMMQGVLENPELLRSIMLANPQLRQVMNDNPELAHVLNDPQVLRQSLEAARNPQLMREQMRNTDRAMSNIEALPGGHNMLRQMYSRVQAPLYEAASSSMSGDGGGDSGASGHSSAAPPTAPNTAPLPNPWGPPTPNTAPLPNPWGPPTPNTAQLPNPWGPPAPG